MKLPIPIESVRRTKTFSVSHLTLPTQCSWRFVLQNEKYERLIPLSPEVSLGIAIHKIIEDATKKGKEEILSVLKVKLLQGEVKTPSAGSQLGCISICDTIPFSVLMEKIAHASLNYCKPKIINSHSNSSLNVARVTQ